MRVSGEEQEEDEEEKEKKEEENGRRIKGIGMGSTHWAQER